MCITRADFSSTILFKDFDKNKVQDKKSTADNVIDLTDPSTLNNELSQDVQDTMYLKIKDGQYLKVDLSSPENKAVFESFKGKILSDDGTIRESFLKLAESEPTDISIEKLFKSVDISTEQTDSSLSTLEQLGKDNRSVAELLKKFDTNIGSGGSLKFQSISKQEIADYMVTGEPSEHIQDTMKLLGRTGEWSALNSVIELNNVRKVYLEKSNDSLNEKISQKTGELNNTTNPEDKEKIQQEINGLNADKLKNSDEISDIVKNSQTMGSIAMKKRTNYTSNEIHKSEQKLAVLSGKIDEAKKNLEIVKNDPVKLAEAQKNLDDLKKQYNYIKEHMNTVSKDTEHDAKFMDNIISNREEKGLKVDHHSKEMATSVHSVAARNNITFAKISTKESVSGNDTSAKDVKEKLDKVKGHIDKVENYNPEFKNPIPQPKNPSPDEKKLYQETVSSRDDLFDLKVDYVKTQRDTTTDLLEKGGVTNNKGIFEVNKEKRSSEKLTDEEKKVIKEYHSEGYKLDKIANTQADILTKELTADKEINNELKTPEEKHEYTAKVGKIISYKDISTDIKDEQTNIIIADVKAKNSTRTLNNELKAKNEEYKQTSPSDDPKTKTEFDSIIDERTENVNKLTANQDKIEAINKAIKDLPDNDMGDDLKKHLQNQQTKLMRDIPRLKSQIAENNERIAVLYNKHKELEEGSKREEKPADHFEEKDFIKGAKLNKNIADNQKKLDEINAKVTGKITNFALKTISIGSSVQDYVDKSKNALIKQINSDKAAFEKLNIKKTPNDIKNNEIPPKGSINSIKADIKNNSVEAEKSKENKKLLFEAAKENGKASDGYDFDLERESKGITNNIESEEKLLDAEPKWAKTDKEYQTFKAKQYYKIADKRTDLSPNIAYLEAENGRVNKIEGFKEKYHNDKFQKEVSGQDVKNITEEKMQSDAENASDKVVDDFRSSFKQIEDERAVTSLNKADEIFNNLKSAPNTPLSNDELIDMTKTSVRSSNKVASGNADINAEVSVQILKKSSENIDKLSGDYKLANGEVIKGDDLKKELHDEISETSARSVDVALKRKMIFDGKYISSSTNPDAVRSAAQDLLDLAVKEADKVKKLDGPKVKEVVAEKEKNITNLKENLAKIPEDNKEERKKIQDEIADNQKSIETINKFGVVSRGAVIAYSVKENYDNLSKQAIIEAKDHLTKLKEERSKTHNLYDYKIDQVKDKREEHTTFSGWANILNPGDFDTDTLDTSLDLISDKYGRQMAQVNAFANNYEMAVKNGKPLEFISALKENRDAKEVYDNDTTTTKDDHYAAVTLKNNESYFKSTESKYIAHEGQTKMLPNGSRQLLSKFGGLNDGTFSGIINSVEDKTSYNAWDPTIESFVKKGGPSENNSFKDAEKDTKYYNKDHSLLAGGYQADLADVEKMDGKYTDRRLSEMVGLDPKDLAIHTGADWFDNTVNGIGAFLDRPETIEMLVEIAVIEVATAGTGTLLALGSELKNAASAVKLASKISDFEKASEAVNLASKGITEAREALTVAKEAKDAEKVIALEKQISAAEKGLDALQTNKVKAFKEVEDATSVVKKLADKRVREIVKTSKIESSGFIKKTGHKVFDMAKQKVIETVINKASVAVFGENSNMAKLTGILTSASKTNRLTSFGDLSSKVLKEFSSQIAQTSTTKLGENLYAKAVYGTSADKLSPAQKSEAELFGSLFSQATSAAASFVNKKLTPEEITPQKELVDIQMKALFPGLEPKAHKEISAALDSLHSSAKLTPEKNMKKLEEFEAAVKKHYPNYESNKKVQEFIKNQTANVIVRDLDKTNLLDYEKVLKEHFIEHNKNNPDKVFDPETVNKMTSQLVIQKAIENVKPLEFDPKKLETPESKKDFEDHVNRKMKEIKGELAKVMPNGPQADIVSNMAMKLYVSDLANGKNVSPDTKKYLNDVSNSLEIKPPVSSVKPDEKVSIPSVESKNNIKPTITTEESQNLAKNSIKSFDANLEKNPQAHKEISESLEGFYKETDPDKAREKLDEFKNKIETHYPDAKKSPEKVKAYQLIQEQLVKLSISEMKSSPDISDPLEFGRDVRMHLEKYNLKNPKREIENHFIEKAYEEAITNKAFEGVKKFDLENFDGKGFEAKIKDTKAEIVNKLSKTMRKDIAEDIADMAIKNNLSELHKNAPSDKEGKYVDNLIKSETTKIQNRLLLGTRDDQIKPFDNKPDEKHNDDYMHSLPLKHDISESSYKELEKMNNGGKLIEAYQSIHISSQRVIAKKIESVMSDTSISAPNKEKIIKEITNASEAYSKRLNEIEVNKSSIKNETIKLIRTNKEIESKLENTSLTEPEKNSLKTDMEKNSDQINKNLKTLVGMKDTNQMWTEEKRLNEITEIAVDIYAKKNFSNPANFTGITKKVYDELPNVKNINGDQIFKNIEEFHLASRKLPSELSIEQREGLKKIREKVSIIPPEGKKIIKVEVGGIYERNDRESFGGFVVEPEFLSHAKNKEEVIIKILRLDYPGSPYLDDKGHLKKGIDVKISVGTVKPDEAKTAYSKEFDEDGMDIISHQYPFGGGSFVLSSGNDQVGTPEYKIADGKGIKPEKVFRSFDEFKKSLDDKDPVFNQP